MNAEKIRQGRRRYVIPAKGYAYQDPQSLKGQPLTDAEDRVMHLVCEGITRKQMADRLSISIKTVDKHVSAINAKFGTDCAVRVLRHAIIHGLYKLDIGVWPGNPS